MAEIEREAMEYDVVIVGAGPAGLSAAITAAERGHDVTIFDRASEIGGQLNLAKQVAGKEEFWGFVDWYRTMIAFHGITVELGTEVSANDLDGFDEVIIATGVIPRDPQIPGQNSGNVVSYIDVLNGTAKAGSGGHGAISSLDRPCAKQGTPSSQR